MSPGQAAVQLFWRLNHARQTVDFVRRQIARFSKLDRAAMSVMEALSTLNTLREYESALLSEGVFQMSRHDTVHHRRERPCKLGASCSDE